MDELKLINGFTFPIEDGACLSNITHLAASDEAALEVCDQLTAFNCSHVEFLHNGMVAGTYDELVLAALPVRQKTEGGVSVSFGLRGKSV